MKKTRKVNFGHGFYGDTFEDSIRNYLGIERGVARGNRTDLIINGKRCEIKTGAGELKSVYGKLLFGVSSVIYCPVVNPKLPLHRQEAFYLTRDNFIAVLNECGLIRTKVTTNGRDIFALQTIYNHTQQKPHSLKTFTKFIDGLYNNEMMPFDETLLWLKEQKVT